MPPIDPAAPDTPGPRRETPAIIFLDIDGVLNDHSRHPNGYCGIKPECVYRLNRIIEATGARIVVSSAWRCMVNGGAMTLEGFRYLLLIHGLTAKAELLPCTMGDERMPGRGPQIAFSVERWRREDADLVYVVIDDGSDELPQHPESVTLSQSLRIYHGERWVQTDSSVGLTDADADRAIAILRGVVADV